MLNFQRKKNEKNWKIFCISQKIRRFFKFKTKKSENFSKILIQKKFEETPVIKKKSRYLECKFPKKFSTKSKKIQSSTKPKMNLSEKGSKIQKKIAPKRINSPLKAHVWLQAWVTVWIGFRPGLLYCLAFQVRVRVWLRAGGVKALSLTQTITVKFTRA